MTVEKRLEIFNIITEKGKSVPLQAEVPRGFQEVKVARLRDNGPAWW